MPGGVPPPAISQEEGRMNIVREFPPFLIQKDEVRNQLPSVSKGTGREGAMWKL